MSDSVITAIATAVEADPANVALREHLARLLLEAGRAEESWAHATFALSQEPANMSVLAVAAEAGEQTGRAAEAEGYRTLLGALDAAPAATDTTQPPPPPPAAATPPPAVSPPPPPAPHASAPEPPAAPPVEPERAPPIPAGGPVPDSADELIDMWGDTAAATDPELGELSAVSIRLSDVGGMEDVKHRLQTSFLTPMQNPEMQAAFGKSMRGGLLLWGPPGCGKTFIAKAVAGELNASFYHVGLSDVLDMWIGSSEKNLAAIFETARANAPCVLFLDEVDALGQKRTQLRGGGGAMRGVVNSLLQEMDGASKDNEGVFILAATNHPWDIDSALLRPGRLDRTLLVLPPDLPARAAILELHLRGRPTEKLDLEKAAKHTDGLTGADLSMVCEQATEYAMEASISSGTIRPITMKDMARAIKEVRPSHGPWTESAKNFALFNNEDGRYDDLLAWIKSSKRR